MKIVPYHKCELRKLAVTFVSSTYACAGFTVAAPKHWNSLPGHLRIIYDILLHSNFDFIHICYRYNLLHYKYIIIRLFCLYKNYYYRLYFS